MSERWFLIEAIDGLHTVWLYADLYDEAGETTEIHEVLTFRSQAAATFAGLLWEWAAVISQGEVLFV